jgi:vitamin B12 transporter
MGPRLRGDEQVWGWVALAFVLAVPAAARASEPSTPTPPPAPAVSGLVVTATRLPTKQADVPDVIVIDRSKIDQLQAVTAADVLKTVPGIALTDDGAFGGVTSVRMRGASSDKVLVLVDGVVQNDASDPNGAYDFSHLSLADVDNIQILEGPQSSIWGSDAIGGVISVTTRELDGWRVQGEGGSLTTFDGSAGIGKRTDDWAVGLSLDGDRTDGVSKADGFPERDGFWQWDVGGYGRVNIGPSVVLDAHASYTQSHTDTDGYNAFFEFGDLPSYAPYRSWQGDVRAVIQDPWGFKETALISGSWLQRGDIDDPNGDSTFTASREDVRWTAERGGPDDRFGVIFGAERESERGSLSTGFSQSLGTTSGFVEARVRPVEPLTLTAAVRYDAPDTFNGQATGHVSAALKLGDGFSLEGAWGQGFKTPTISEIACDFCFPSGPSVGLRPEHAQGYDVALAWASDDGRLRAKLTGYEFDVRDQIAFAASFPFVYVNIGRSRSTGLEAEIDAKLTPEITLSGEYAYTDAVDVSDATPMLRVPRNAGSVTLAWDHRRWHAAVLVRSEGPDADEDPSTFLPATRPGFTTANLTGAYDLTSHLQLTARVEDLAGTHYEEVLGYGEPRRMVFFGIKARG